MTREQPFQRKIRSFVMRTGRMTEGQKQALERGWPDYGLAHDQGRLDLEAVFGRSAPVVFEIGFGNGDSLFEMARQAPEKDFIGVEVHTPGVGRLLHHVLEHDLDNLRVFREDAVDILEDCIDDHSLSGIQVFFPDPWHKKRHHKRRLIQPAFVALARRKLASGGRLHVATDWQNYAEHIMEVLSADPGLENAAGPGRYSHDTGRPATKFEQRGQRRGHGVWDIVFHKP